MQILFIFILQVSFRLLDVLPRLQIDPLLVLLIIVSLPNFGQEPIVKVAEHDPRETVSIPVIFDEYQEKYK